MQAILTLCAILEAATGLALLGIPAVVSRLLFWDGGEGGGLAVSRIAGLGLLSLGIGCWPGRGIEQRNCTFWGMLTYNGLVALYLAWMGAGRYHGVLIWPAVVLHAILTALLLKSLGQKRNEKTA